jgi:excinuclease ABC subunit B
MDQFILESNYKPTGDQPQAIKKIVEKLKAGDRYITLLGATGTGKTFTMANVINDLQRPALIVAHNKTLAAQLCSEFQEFFPNNAVHYFVSYYDYYQPEAYVAATDTYIEKDASINEEINKYRHAATVSLLTRKDVIIIATVSCIYGLGSVDDYQNVSMTLKVGDEKKRDKILRHLTDMQYTRSRLEFKQGMFHVLGDVVEIFPPSSDNIYSIEFFGDEIEKITECDSFTGEILRELSEAKIFPAKHDVTTKEKIQQAISGIKKDMEERYEQLQSMGKMLEAERIRTRTEYDIEMMQETGYCSGIENYTRYLNDREPGVQPATLIDYFPDNFLMMIDESHITVPQIGGMHAGNRSRKDNLVEHGFRLPSSQDNRPLNFTEFEGHMKQALMVTATPSRYEYENTPKENIIEQIIRPTGLVDPVVEVLPTKGQIKSILAHIKEVISRNERAFLTTLTKKSSEALTEYLALQGVKVKYLHSEIDTMERLEILRDLRLGEIDVVVGINLLREGLDLPEVSFIGILDANKQGFLRSTTALIQTIGRAARNINGYVAMYADTVSDAMQKALDETDRRRAIQVAYNEKHGITPKTILKAVKDLAQSSKDKAKKNAKHYEDKEIPVEERKRLLKELNTQMELASQNLEFEKAAELRDEIEILSEQWKI